MENTALRELRDTFSELRRRGDFARIDFWPRHFPTCARLVGITGDAYANDKLQVASEQGGAILRLLTELPDAVRDADDNATAWWLFVRHLLPLRCDDHEIMAGAAGCAEVAADWLLVHGKLSDAPTKLRKRMDPVSNVTKSTDEGILHLFRRALADADSLVAMANRDSAEVGWRSADSACHQLFTLLQCVDKLLFDADIRQHLELCPPSGCTPDGAELPGLKLRNISWHHLACDLTHDVAMKAIEWIDADARFLFVEREPGNDEFEYVVRPHTDDVEVVYHDVRHLKPGEKRAARLAEMLGHIRERGHACWPAVAGALRMTGLNSDRIDRVWTGVRREWCEIARSAQRLVGAQLSELILPQTESPADQPGRPPLPPMAAAVDRPKIGDGAPNDAGDGADIPNGDTTNSKALAFARPVVMTQAEAARHIGVSEKTVGSWIKKGELSVEDCGSGYKKVFDRDELDLKQQTKKRTKGAV